MKNLVLDVLVDADAATVFRAFTDWRAQGRWMVGTDVRPVVGDGHGVGARLEAWSGLGRFGFLDTMVITEWDDDRRVVVEHTGNVVRGSGVMEVFGLPHGRSRTGAELSPVRHCFAVRIRSGGTMVDNG